MIPAKFTRLYKVCRIVLASKRQFEHACGGKFSIWLKKVYSATLPGPAMGAIQGATHVKIAPDASDHKQADRSAQCPANGRRRAHAWLSDADIVLLNAFEFELEATFRLAGMNDDRIHEYRIQAREVAMAEMDAFIATLEVPAGKLTRQFVHGAATLRISVAPAAENPDIANPHF